MMEGISMPIKLDAPTVSVIVSGCVAVTVIIFPLILNLLSENLKWARQKKSAETERIEKVTKALMDTLSEVWAGRHTVAEVIQSKLLSCFYEWERAIWPYCGMDEQESVKRIRQDIEIRNTLNNKSDDYHKELSDELHQLTFIAIRKI